MIHCCVISLFLALLLLCSFAQLFLCFFVSLFRCLSNSLLRCSFIMLCFLVSPGFPCDFISSLLWFVVSLRLCLVRSLFLCVCVSLFIRFTVSLFLLSLFLCFYVSVLLCFFFVPVSLRLRYRRKHRGCVGPQALDNTAEPPVRKRSD